MTRYMAVRLLTGGAAIGLEALSSYYGGIGRTVPGMVANVTAMVLNVALNWVFIWGHLGAPALGVVGSALASCLATGVAFAGFFAWFLHEGRGLPRPALSVREWARMVRFGLPNGFNWLFEFAAFVFFVNVVMGGLGTAALAAMNSVLALNSLAFMPAFGVASAGAILVGQAIGAGAKDEVPGAVSLTLKVALLWQGLVGVVYLCFPALLMIPFARGADAEAVRAMGVKMLLVSAAWQLFDATATTFAETLRAAGDTFFPLMVRLLVAWCLFAPGAWLTVRRYGGDETGAMVWLVAYLGLLALVLVLRFRSGAWRRVQLVDPLAT